MNIPRHFRHHSLIAATPGYTETTPLPVAPAKWSYKAIFRMGDDEQQRQRIRKQ